ncbi:ribonuclease HI family protein [Weissella bombi]|uniref:Ribonuclease HI n=1 Tax=Weissella bombi TaxID=1505725 RepID=A0A1C4AHG7_9LACO|nr:ribonuclease HI family protein [Weissella bombi]SCB93993.1 ribonuclease HI [Weissella bombi]
MLIKIYSDAASQGNPGRSGAGVVILYNGQQIQKHHYLGVMSNHEAEFAAAIWAFEELAKIANSDDTIMYYADSKLVIDSIKKRYAKHFSEPLSNLLAHQDQYELLIPNWIPEKQNHGAHQLAWQAIHHA